ncbi:MAG: LysM peptidoglycan-binding domain-containing protein, partial [Dehalococcoidales bacterium]|nr:LysM peptidoglycan-binding domain-containing protein [Dehalococcoidales bacterium]
MRQQLPPDDNHSASIDQLRPGTECGWIYTVRAGDNLFSIARRFGIPVVAIINANRLWPPYIIYPNQKLVLPIQVHTVTRGQTLYSIGNLYDVDWQRIARVNNLRPPYTIYVGQKLAIPGEVCQIPRPRPTLRPTRRPTPRPTFRPTPRPTWRPYEYAESLVDPLLRPYPRDCGWIYTVEQGDTLNAIADKYSIPVDDIIEVNPDITSPDLIYPGQKIIVPVQV